NVEAEAPCAEIMPARSNELQVRRSWPELSTILGDREPQRARSPHRVRRHRFPIHEKRGVKVDARANSQLGAPYDRGRRGARVFATKYRRGEIGAIVADVHDGALRRPS